MSLCEKCSNMEFSLVHIFPYSVQIRENVDQKKLRIWTFLTQCVLYPDHYPGFKKEIGNT